MASARIDEIFTSVQGEGPRVGERHIFVRFLGCELRCRYCDTPAARRAPGADGPVPACRAQKNASSPEREDIPNPLSPARLTECCSRLATEGRRRPWISLTGGEPLHQQEFLADWLPGLRDAFRTYLETGGIHFHAVEAVMPFVDVVSMDLKLPSATGLRPFWDEHERFLRAVLGREVFAKAVVTRETESRDVIAAASVIAAVDAKVPLILQPATGPLAPDIAAVLSFQETALAIIDDVRVIPQVHKMLNVP